MNTPTDTATDIAKALEVLVDDLVTDVKGAEIADVKSTWTSQDISAGFRRKQPTYEDKHTAKPKRVSMATRKATRMQYQQGANATLLEYPTDRWGLTKDVKTAMTELASRIGGQEDKYNLAKEVLKILNDHLELKFKADKAYRESVQ